MPLVLGVDLGATNLRVAVGEPSGAIAARATEPVPASGELLAQRVAALARRLAGGEPIAGAAVGVPGVPGVPGGRGFGSMIAGAAGLAGAPLRELLGAALGLPVALENDCNLAALGEQRRRGVADLAFIAVGTGVGMGIVSGGRLLRGATGGAGELGHLPLGGPAVVDGGLGPLEAIAGGAGLAARWSGPAPAVFAAAARGDERARRLLDDQARALAAGVRAVQALLDPALVVLGGGIGSRPDVLERVRAALGPSGPPIEPSVLGEDAGLVGALIAAGAQ
jgi:glucokinase